MNSGYYEFPSGRIEWVRYGKLHRPDGPAVYYPPGKGQNEYYLNGKEVSIKKLLQRCKGDLDKELEIWKNSDYRVA